MSAETVWNNGAGSGATGGGVSGAFSRPDRQAAAGVPGTGRGVPDVAGNADPETGYLVGDGLSDHAFGGTSAVAPLWAALVAQLNQRLGSQAGFLNPLVY